MATPVSLADIDVATPDAYADGIPHARFAALRAQDPVHWHPWPWSGGGFWAVTRRRDVLAISRDWQSWSSAVGHIYLWEPSPEALEARRSMIETDPPDHTRLRRIVSKAFTARKVREYEEVTRTIARRLIDDLPGPGGEVDLVPALCAPLPINVLVTILGVPEEDTPYLLELTDHLVEGTSGEPLDPGAYGNTTPLELLPFNSPASHALFEFARRIGDLRRADPRDDLVSRLVHVDENGEQLTDAEFTNFFQLLVFAGNETTRTAMAQGLNALLDHPEEWERLRRDPGLAERATEEIMRWSSPIIAFRRTAICDTTIGETPVRAGDKAVLFYASANFDEDAYPEPLRFDVGRDDAEATSFGGGGPHFCLGAWLARLEVQVLLEELLARDVRLERAGPPVRIRSNFVHGLSSVPARVVSRR